MSTTVVVKVCCHNISILKTVYLPKSWLPNTAHLTSSALRMGTICSPLVTALTSNKHVIHHCRLSCNTREHNSKSTSQYHLNPSQIKFVEFVHSLNNMRSRFNLIKQRILLLISLKQFTSILILGNLQKCEWPYVIAYRHFWQNFYQIQSKII